ncbi:DNA-binding transcriptional repressor MalI [Aquimixticola soesokkakensis]|uniref:DNA-binding transcriptional repressor MalI n=1 Tax=Aquimixticola soesokkakensis TaxID=1519096 RepID=A0A1Y5TMM1_9RHOB|nr:LacI family DNA-binding transcriptional regulator [Aquimixticola soesokkakensis]SLN67642.1 DNA-binding transcriptional repressor MalI [Aquimixticola soesokkakensis]
MKRPTIASLAQEAGVSIATVNRLLSGHSNVKAATAQRIQIAAEKIGFYGLGTIEDQIKKNAPTYRLGFLLQQSSRDLYQLFSREITAACHRRQLDIVEPVIEFVDTLTPENISARLLSLGERCDAVSLIAADHPQIGQTIRTLSERGIPVIPYITDQSAPERAAFVGTDNWKIGRTAAWLISQMTNEEGHIAVFQGNPRYQCQDVADASFRSLIREYAPHLTVAQSQATNEEPDRAYEMVRDLLQTEDKLLGIFIVGGGISGVLRALREIPVARRKSIKLICRDIGPETRRGLSEGLITAALAHPLEPTSNTLVATMIEVLNSGANSGAQGATIHRTVPFEIITPENI